MSRAQSQGDPMSTSQGHGNPNSSELHSFPIYSAASGWEHQQMPSLAWLQNAGALGLQRVLPPIVVPTASGPLDGAMDPERSFTDIITRGCNPAAFSDNVLAPNETPSCDEALASVKGNQKRSKNFSKEEDVMLVSAWLNVSLDPVQGVDQSRSTYWRRIYDYFHINKTFDSDRTQSSLMSRWSGILRDVNLYAGCLSKIEARNQSGLSIADKEKNALRMFKCEDKHHRDFPYIHCCEKWKDQAKWKNRSNQSGTTSRNKQKSTPKSSLAAAAQLVATSNGEDSQATLPTVDRPAGTKKEKQKLKQRSSIEALDYLLAKKKEVDAEKELKKKDRELKKEEREMKKHEMCQKALALQEERIKLDNQKFDFERDREEERIMNVDMSTMSTKQPQFYANLQEKILARRLENQ